MVGPEKANMERSRLSNFYYQSDLRWNKKLIMDYLKSLSFKYR